MSEALKITEEIEEQEEHEDFVVLDDGAAEWCMKKIREKKEELETWKAHYACQLDRLETRINGDIAYFESKLREYFDMIPHKRTKTQESYQLPGGKLVRKAQQPKYDVKDEELVPWLKQNGLGNLVKVKETADWDKLKKSVSVVKGGVVTEDGEIVPGVKVTERDPIFKVEMK